MSSPHSSTKPLALKQRSLFNQPSVALTPIGSKATAAKAPPRATQRAPFPSLSLLDGLNKSQVQSETMLWHRLIANQSLRQIQDPKARRKFMRAITSEMKIKQGRSNAELLMLDLLLFKNLT